MTFHQSSSVEFVFVLTAVLFPSGLYLFVFFVLLSDWATRRQFGRTLSLGARVAAILVCMS